jgi:hypothetical protein
MGATLEQLENRLAALEKEMRTLRDQGLSPPPVEKPSGHEPFNWGTAWTHLLRQMGIQGQPVGANKVREMVAACGFKTEANAFSRDIIAMRDSLALEP